MYTFVHKAVNGTLVFFLLMILWALAWRGIHSKLLHFYEAACDLENYLAIICMETKLENEREERMRER